MAFHDLDMFGHACSTRKLAQTSALLQLHSLIIFSADLPTYLRNPQLLPIQYIYTPNYKYFLKEQTLCYGLGR